MFGKPSKCPICGGAATESGVSQTLDSRIDCPRCKNFDIDRRALINLHSSRPANWPILSGLARACWERGGLDEPPRLVWVEVEGDRDGKYEFQGIANEPIRTVDKVLKLFNHLAHKTNHTAGEPVFLKLPNDLSLAFARSLDEFGAIVKQLERDGLVEIFRKSPDEYQISLTIQGADHEIAEPEKPDVVSDEETDVKITGSSKGSGAFGRVYPGIQTKLNREVAIKIVEMQAGPDAVAHARGLAKVRHPNVVTVYDVGRVKHPVTGDIVDCVVMELIEGDRLPDIWTGLAKTELLGLCEQIIAGVKAMHAANVCHHDLHAGNVLVSQGSVKIIDIHYTDTGRLSQAASVTKEQLIADDCRRAAWICRCMYWMVNRDVLNPIIEDRLGKVESLDQLQQILVEIEEPQMQSAPRSVVAEVDQLEGLTNADRHVLQLAGDQLVTKDRFDSFVSVPQIADSIGSYEQTNSSIRLLTELRYFKQSDQDHPRFVMLSTYGFDQYLQVFRSGYVTEQRKICTEIVQQERTRDLEIVAMTELPRPIVEHVINVLTSNKLIDSTRYNSETQIHVVSEQLRRQILG